MSALVDDLEHVLSSRANAMQVRPSSTSNGAGGRLAHAELLPNRVQGVCVAKGSAVGQRQTSS